MTEPAKDNGGGPLHSRREKVAFIVVFAAAVVIEIPAELAP